MNDARIEPPTPFLIDGDQSIGSWRDFALVIVRGNSNVTGSSFIDLAIQKAAAWSGRASILVVVEETAPMPSAAARDAMSRVLSTRASSLQAYAAVHEGTGFRAAAVRGVVTGIMLVARPSYGVRVFATTAEAATWLASLSKSATARHLSAALGALRGEARGAPG